MRQRREADAGLCIARIVPTERHPIARQKVAKLVAGEIEAMADDGDGCHRGVDRQLLQRAYTLGHHLQQLRVEPWARDDELAKIGAVEAAHARWLVGAQAGDGWRTEKKR